MSNINTNTAPMEKDDLVRLETVMSNEENLKGDHMNYERVDKELAKYTNSERIVISEADDKRLKKMIDRRVLVIMILTYFLQALDKGTMSFTSIMGIRDDLGLLGDKVAFPKHWFRKSSANQN
jgi:MFS family permease